MSKYLNKEGVQVLWDKTKEIVNTVEAKVDEIQDLTDEELLAILADTPALVNFSLYIGDATGYREDLGTFQFVEGMTWAEFCDSEYNTVATGGTWKSFGFDDSDDKVYSALMAGGFVWCDEDGQQRVVLSSDVIVANAEYHNFIG